MTTQRIVALVLVILSRFVLSQQSESFECGKRKIAPPDGENDNYLEDSYHGQFPWYTAVYHLKGFQSLKFVCGGTLISQKFVLTSTQCVTDERNKELKVDTLFVQLGVRSLNAAQLLKEKYRKVKSYQIPEENVRKIFYDICLLELSRNVQFNDFIQPACVSPLSTNVESWISFVGWRKAENSGQLSVQSRFRKKFCLFGREDRSFMICDLTDGIKIEPDLGGGSYMDVDGVWYVTGVRYSETSCKDYLFAAKCVRFTTANVYVKWIKSITNLPYLHPIELKYGKNVVPSQNYPNLLPRHCGNFIAEDIVNSPVTKPYEFPWMALVGFKDFSEISFSCVGSIINKRYVLTSKECANPSKSNFIRLGVHDIGDIMEMEVPNEKDCAPLCQDFNVEVIVHHHNLTEDPYNNNIALIRVEKDIVFEDNIQPICLAGAPGIELQTPLQYISTGWDTPNHPGYGIHSILKKRTFLATDFVKCDQRYFASSHYCTNLTRSEWRGGEPLGYPMPHNHGLKFVQFGLYSYTISNFAPHFVSVHHHILWILANMEN